MKKSATYKVIFDTKGGSTVADMTIKARGKITKPAKLGWYADEGLSNVFDFNTSITQNITLYLKKKFISYIIILAGDENRDFKNGDRVNTQFNNAYGVAVDNAYVADQDNNCICKIILK